MKSSFRGRVEIFCQGEFFWARRRGIPVLAQMEFKEANFRLWESYESLKASLSICGAVKDLTQELEPNIEIWELLLQWPAALGLGADPAVAVEAFHLNLLEVLGWGPDWRLCSLCGGNMAEEKSAAVDAREGILLCGNCGSGREGLIRLNQAETGWLQKIKKKGMEAANEFPGEAEIGKFKRLNSLLYQYHAEYKRKD